MKKLLFILSICATTNYGFCQAAGEYKKSSDGMEYKIVRKGNTNLLQYGQYIELHFTNLFSHDGKDSVLTDTRNGSGSQIIAFDSVNIPPTYFNIFKELNEGDSLSTRTLVDSVFKQDVAGMPRYMKLGDYVATNIAIVNVYKTKAEADVVIKKNQEKAKQAAEKVKEAAGNKAKFQAVNDDLAITNYLVSNNIKATKTPSGVYVSITKEGTGPMLNNKQLVKLMYRGKTLKGFVFDTNMDESKGHTEPLTANLTAERSLGNGVIPGMVDALLTMKIGTKGSMFIPSGLAYGTRGAGGDIGPNENMIFDVEVISAQSVEQYKLEQGIADVRTEAVKATTPTKKATIKKVPVKKTTKVVKKVVKKK